ncbi:hypothetical protein DVH26_10070 [Paenibacillus sp. H1-7]|uniref:hypothetical protein n=1 Tax=Paenibacillus sp. H1-7 TaxID=2282849 RepID=UPI001EF871CE|nr:hypothetical protein [Paenibacillus sp. H1-7]ULL14764.1 hypothetical protein DVH26_10070 [Paenibacillus sp. H1-7]
MEMRNEKGEVLAILNVDSLQEENTIDIVIRELRPGMGKGIYLADDKKISQQTNYAPVKWLDGLDKLKAKASSWEPVFPANAEVMDIQVYYGFDNLTQEEINEMAIESAKTGKDVVRDLKPNDTFVGVSLLYRKEETTFEFRIFGTTKSRIHVPDVEKHTIEHLTIRTNEAVYVGDNEIQQLIWAEVGPTMGKALQYEVLAERSNRDWLISISESLS